jgi:hypothetical protein
VAASGTAPAATPDATAKPLIPVLEITPVAPAQRSSSPANALLGGTPNRRAAALVRDQLKAAGLDLPGLEVYVLPVAGTHDELLVVEIEAAAGGGPAGTANQDPTPLFKALATLETSEIANVKSVVFNLHGEDAGKPAVFTVVMPMAVIADAARGATTSDELLRQLRFEVRPEGAQ